MYKPCTNIVTSFTCQFGGSVGTFPFGHALHLLISQQQDPSLKSIPIGQLLAHEGHKH